MSYYSKPIEPIIKAIIRDDSDEMIHLLYEDENLLNSCLNVNIKSLHLDKIEYLACYFKAFKCIEILTLLKVDFDSIQCLNAAAAGGSLEIFERVYSLPKKNFFNKEYVLVPASVAAKFGNINILQYIFSKADAVLKNNCHHPIIAAAKYDQVECLQFLLDITSDTNRNKYFFKDVCIAANKTKSDRTLITLYKKYPTPEVRKLIKKFVFKCDSPYLYNEYFGGEKITRGIAQRIIYSNAQRIIKYLISIGADLNQMLVFINMQGFELLKLSIWSDPIGYFNKIFSSNRTAEEKMIILSELSERIQTIKQDQFLQILRIFEPSFPNANEIVKNYFNKVDKDNKFINKVFIEVLKKGFINAFDDFDFAKQFDGDISKAWKISKLPGDSLIYLWKNDLIKSQQLNPNLLQGLIFSNDIYKDETGRNYVDEIVTSVGPLDLFINFFKEGIYSCSLLRYIITMHPELKTNPNLIKIIENHWSDYLPDSRILFDY